METSSHHERGKQTRGSVSLKMYFNGIEIFAEHYAKGDFPIPDAQRLHIGSRYLWTDSSKTFETKALLFCWRHG